MKVARTRQLLAAAPAVSTASSLGGILFSSTEKTTEQQIPGRQVVARGPADRVVNWVWIPTGGIPPVLPAQPRLP
jgi:hypothetical protein